MSTHTAFLLGSLAGASFAFCLGFAFGIACSYIAALKKSNLILPKTTPLEPGITGMYD